MAGVHPEPEIGRFLSNIGFEGVPEFGGCLERLGDDGWMTVAYLQRWITGRSAWDIAQDLIRNEADMNRWAFGLGQRIGELHQALRTKGSAECADFAFGTKPFARKEVQLWVGRVQSLAEELHATLCGHMPKVMNPATWRQARRLWVEGESLWKERLRQLATLDVQGVCSRVHGDLHLGQLIDVAENGQTPRWMVVDFEGEPLRPLAARRVLDLPLRDIAGMWRSFAYAFAVAGQNAGGSVSKKLGEVQGALLEGLSGKLEPPAGKWRELLDGLVWEKAIYETLYEMCHRPEWMHIPLQALANG
jgi:predicted trehalose synthase